MKLLEEELGVLANRDIGPPQYVKNWRRLKLG